MRKEWHLETYTLVSEDGKTVERRWTDGNGIKTNYELKITCDPEEDKRHRVYTKGFGFLYVDELVLGAFGNPKPGPEYVVRHKDGDWQNDNLLNLCWDLRANVYLPRQVTTAKHVKLDYKLTVFKDGTIKQGKDKLNVISNLSDGDIDLHVPITPQVRYYVVNSWGRNEEIRVSVEELMERAGYIAGNKKAHLNPKVLHKDHDKMNFASDNLEWVDASDPRWVSYKNSWPSDFEVYSKLNPHSIDRVKHYLGIS